MEHLAHTLLPGALYSVASRRTGSGTPRSVGREAPKSSTWLWVDLRDSWFLRRRPCLERFHARLRLVAFVADAMARRYPFVLAASSRQRQPPETVRDLLS